MTTEELLKLKTDYAAWFEPGDEMNLSEVADDVTKLVDELLVTRGERDAAIKRAEEANQYSLGMEDKANELRAQLAAVERYGADQWRRGNAGQEPQELAEWKGEQP